jgi:hypothetical protein
LVIHKPHPRLWMGECQAAGGAAGGDDIAFYVGDR